MTPARDGAMGARGAIGAVCLGLSTACLAVVLTPWLVAGNPNLFQIWPVLVAVGVGALWFARRSQWGAAALFMAVIWAVMALPLLVVFIAMLSLPAPVWLQTVAVATPEYVFFGPRIYASDGGLPLLGPLGGAVTALLWIAAALAFNRVTRTARLPELWLLMLAATAIAVTALMFAAVVPLAGWQLRLNAQ